MADMYAGLPPISRGADIPEADYGEPIYEEDPDSEKEDDIIRAKWSMDGAKTLSEAAAMLRQYADALIELEANGWRLTDPVEDDYGFIERAEERS